MTETNKEKLLGTLQDFKDIFGVLPIIYAKTCSTPFGNSKETISFLADENKNDIMQKIEYDLEAYDDDLRHKHQPKIRILRAEFNENEENRSGIAVNFN
jgi:hypothetical protein